MYSKVTHSLQIEPAYVGDTRFGRYSGFSPMIGPFKDQMNHML